MISPRCYLSTSQRKSMASNLPRANTYFRCAKVTTSLFLVMTRKIVIGVSYGNPVFAKDKLLEVSKKPKSFCFAKRAIA